MLPLEPTDDLAKPAFRDAATCAKWLSQLQLTNLNLAQGTLRTQLNEFSRYPLRGKDRLQTLEVLREIVDTVQTDFAKKLFGKKLPLADTEFASLLALVSLWQGMLNGYLRCSQSREAGDATLAADAALIAQRCLLYSGLQLGEFLRAGYDPDGKSWQHFHAIYAHIEQQGLLQQSAADQPTRGGQPVTCRTQYVRMLLLHRARLLGLTRNQWHIAGRWLELWGDCVTIEPRFSMSKEDAPPLAIDLNGERGLIPVQRATASASMRYLAMVPLSKLIRVKTILLQQGQSPQQLELGEELNNKECIELLGKLHACWCERRHEPLMDEARDTAVVNLCNGLENIYAHLAGKPFKAPSAAGGIADKEKQKQIETFGRVLDETDRHKLSELGFLAEEWLVEEDGLMQARLLRKTSTGERLGINQIVCVQKPGAATYKVGVVTLCSVSRGGLLYIGVRYLPGIPQAIIIRGSASGNLLSGAAAALLLPEMPNLRIPASLLIPRDWFQAGRQFDLTLPENQKQSVALGISVDKGADYERVSFAAKG